jgi:hypothetical protein
MRDERENGRTYDAGDVFRRSIAFCWSKGFDALIRLVRFRCEKTFACRLDNAPISSTE